MSNNRPRVFACSSCPVCEGFEARMHAAKMGGYEPQLEYCGCDKVGTAFYISGHCEDAFNELPGKKPDGMRRSGSAYRRHMARRKDARLRDILTHAGERVGRYPRRKMADGIVEVESHVVYPKHTGKQRDLKRRTSKAVRRNPELTGKGNQHRKLCGSFA